DISGTPGVIRSRKHGANPGGLLALLGLILTPSSCADQTARSGSSGIASSLAQAHNRFIGGFFPRSSIGGCQPHRGSRVSFFPVTQRVAKRTIVNFIMLSKTLCTVGHFW